MAEKIALIAIDWGTTNRRGWALSRDGKILGQRADAGGLLSVPAGGFAQSFAGLVGDWRSSSATPVIMCGMVGSKKGWVEAPYLQTPLDLEVLSANLCTVPGIDNVWIVPGVSHETSGEIDVIRGEECQILAALLSGNLEDAVLILPGTHSKWAVIDNRRLVRFRTYMTGEIFELVQNTGTLSQVMRKGEREGAAFDRGVGDIRADGGALMHALFTVRTLGLFGRMTPVSLTSYLSGLLIGAELADGLNWINKMAPNRASIAIGSPALLLNYVAAARQFGIELGTMENTAILPSALLAIALNSGLIS